MKINSTINYMCNQAGRGWFAIIFGLVSLCAIDETCRAVDSKAALVSPENQVFQFMQSETCSAWADGSNSKATAYLWVPEQCKRLRGLLVLCANVPEHRLVGHPSIREACAANDLGIVWCVPSFMNFRKDATKGTDMAKEYPTIVAFLQQLLNGLAKTSGYEEVATVPWLPMGESGHLLMVDALVEQCPQRCIAGIWIKNHHFPLKNRQVPALVTFGTAQEWAQDKADIRTEWNQSQKPYESVLKMRRENPEWPLSYIIDGGSGHFDCSERLTAYFARYIDLAAKARLPVDDRAVLNPVDLSKGYLADLPVPGHGDRKVVAAVDAAPEGSGLPWYFDKTCADEARAFAAINWQAETQLPAFAAADGKVLPFDFNGISSVIPVMEEDGVTFTLHGVMLDQLPNNFVGAGEKLVKAPGAPAKEWLCGPVVPISSDRFRISLDRSWPSCACYLAARQHGTDQIREAVQPCGVKLQKNTTGTPQKITFDPIPDVPAAVKSIRLSAKSDLGLMVRFFVRAGPAVIQGDQLIFTPIPPRSKRPLTVTVCAWQWGRAIEPAVQMATAEIDINILPSN